MGQAGTLTEGTGMSEKLSEIEGSDRDLDKRAWECRRGSWVLKDSSWESLRWGRGEIKVV